MADLLSPEERAFLSGIGPPAKTAAPATTTTTPDTTTTTTVTAPPVAEAGPLSAVRSGVTSGLATVVNSPADWARRAGFDVQPPAPMPPLSPMEQAAVQAHPWLYGGGQTAGELVGTAPAIGLSEAALPAAGYRFLPNALRGAGQGAMVNALTSAEAPNESMWVRLPSSAATGALLGGIAGKVGGWFGRDVSLASPDVQNAAAIARRAGIDVGVPNMPLAGEATKVGGAPALGEQTPQINRALGNLVGESFPKYDAGIQAGIDTRLGSAISNAANRGSVNLIPGSPLERELTGVANDIANLNRVDPLNGGRLQTELNKVLGAFTDPANPGVMPGRIFDSLVGSGSRLRTLTDSVNDNVRTVAQRLDSALDAAFGASSPGVYRDWVNARTNYRLWKGIQRNLDPQGNIQPGTLWTDLQRQFPDLKSRAPGSTVGDAGQLASSIDQLFTGAGRAWPPPQSLWATHSPVLAGVAPYLAGEGPINLLQHVPSLQEASQYATAHMPTLVASALLGGGADLLKWLGRRYQASNAFANALIARGTQAAPNWFSGPVAGAGTVAAPTRGRNQ